MTETALPALAPEQLARLAQGRRQAVGLVVGLGIVVLVLAVASAALGQIRVTPGQLWTSLVHHFGGASAAASDDPGAATIDAVLWTIRWPRLALAALAGMALATAGALMQGVFTNPLAEPGVVGVSSGAAAVACAAIAFGAGSLGPWAVAISAIAGALGATFLLYTLSRSGGKTEVVTLVLMGVAVNAVAGALIAFSTFMADRRGGEEIVFWQLGSLNGTRGVYLALVTPLVLVGVAGAWLMARRLDLLALGEKDARHLGVDVERLRLGGIVLVGVLTGAAVAFCGVIAFVGLVVPHLVRLVTGPGHRWLIPASALGGAVMLMAADLIARTAMAYAELPIGMLTALVGGPFFFWLLRRTRRRAGGWA
ncbi:MAG: iron ABC transporter permease [Micrococcales bacterium]|nr:iron ABC transporter permease [Micrococcales bacterium]